MRDVIKAGEAFARISTRSFLLDDPDNLTPDDLDRIINISGPVIKVANNLGVDPFRFMIRASDKANRK